MTQGLYKERNLVERMVGYLKHFRRVATRYDKTALYFLSRPARGQLLMAQLNADRT